MQKPDIWKLVLAQLGITKDPTQNDWRSYITRYIIPEVRAETQRFYGPHDDHEIQFPGLDYSNLNHRLRLTAFPYHRQLFNAFDRLRLTNSEIYTLCKWHGTKRVKDEFEKKNGVTIEDTTWESVLTYIPREPTVTFPEGGMSPHRTVWTDEPNTPEGVDGFMQDSAVSENGGEVLEDSNASDEESEDELQQSVGVELNQRLMANAEANAQARARGEMVTTDEQWEQWLKEAQERETASRSSRPRSLSALTRTTRAELRALTQERAHRQAQALAQSANPMHQANQVASTTSMQALLAPESMNTLENTLSSTVEGH